MRTKTLCLIAGSILCLTTNGWAKDDLPKTEPFSHYAPMVKRSPFAVASAAAPTGAKPDFAKDLYVANAAHLTDGDFVTIASTTDKNMKEYLSTRDTVDGYSISNIQWSDRVGETKVTIAKDSQFATLTFNEALLSQAIQNPIAQMPQQPLPGRPQVPPGARQIPTPIQRPMPVPQVPNAGAASAHTRGVIRRRGAPATQPAVQPPPPNPDGDDDNDNE